MSFLDANGLQRFYDGLKARFATQQTMTSVLPASGWNGSGPYTNTVSVNGILGTDTPIVDVYISGQTANKKQQLADAWALINNIQTQNGAIVAECLSSAPSIDIPIKMMVVKKHG